MKKILSIIALMVYLFSINTLVHASTMGIFAHNHNDMEMWHCHTQQQSSTTKTQNIDCCELALSNQYSNIQIPLEYTDYLSHTVPTSNYLIKDLYTPSVDTQEVAWSPWRNTDIKYNKFSDLFGIIVNLS
jgi:hypothetical protein